MDPLHELAEAARSTEVHPRIPVGYAPRFMLRRESWLKRYRKRCGIRSFLFQVIIGIWSVIIWLLLVFYILVICNPRLNPKPPYMTLDQYHQSLGEGGFDIVIVWVVFSLPFMVLAILTLKPDSDQSAPRN
jgi:hypothetical protein